MAQKATQKKPSEILPFFLGCHKKSLLMRLRRPFGFKGQLEMPDYPVDFLGLLYKRDNRNLASTCRATQRIHFIHLADHLCPTFGRETIFSHNDRRMRRTNPRTLVTGCSVRSTRNWSKMNE
jgi:hypothetical protein